MVSREDVTTLEAPPSWHGTPDKSAILFRSHDHPQAVLLQDVDELLHGVLRHALDAVLRDEMLSEHTARHHVLVAESLKLTLLDCRLGGTCGREEAGVVLDRIRYDYAFLVDTVGRPPPHAEADLRRRDALHRVARVRGRRDQPVDEGGEPVLFDWAEWAEGCWCHRTPPKLVKAVRKAVATTTPSSPGARQPSKYSRLAQCSVGLGAIAAGFGGTESMLRWGQSAVVLAPQAVGLSGHSQISVAEKTPSR